MGASAKCPFASRHTVVIEPRNRGGSGDFGHDEDRGRQQQPATCRGHLLLPQHADDQGGGQALQRHGDLRRDPGKCPRPGHVRGAVDLFPRQRPPDGTADHHRRAEAGFGQARHRGDPVFRLCPAGPQARPAHADLGEARRQPHHPRRRGPRADHGSPRRPDPGLLRHPDRQSLRRPGDGARHQEPSRCRQHGHRVARRGRRGARPGARQAPRHAARHRRQAPRAGG